MVFGPKSVHSCSQTFVSDILLGADVPLMVICLPEISNDLGEC